VLLHCLSLCTLLFHRLLLQSVCLTWSFWKLVVVGKLSPSPANTPDALSSQDFLAVEHYWNSLWMDKRWWVMERPELSLLTMKLLAWVGLVVHPFPSLLPQHQTEFILCLVSLFSSCSQCSSSTYFCLYVDWGQLALQSLCWCLHHTQNSVLLSWYCTLSYPVQVV